MDKMMLRILRLASIISNVVRLMGASGDIPFRPAHAPCLTLCRSRGKIARPQRQTQGQRLTMASGKDLRRIALSLDGTVEAPHFDRAAFKVARIYVTLAADGRTANFKFSPDEQEFKCMMAPEAFAPVPNAWGKQGWTTATLAALSPAELKDALETAWRHAEKKPRRPK